MPKTNRNNKPKSTPSVSKPPTPVVNGADEAVTKAASVVVNGGTNGILGTPVSTGESTVVHRLLSFTSSYLKCEVNVYDANLHQAINKMIERLEEFATENESIVTDELRPKIIERHMELLNVRLKLLKLCQSAADSQSPATPPITEPVLPVENPKLIGFKFTHPRELYLNLLSAGRPDNEPLKYAPSITVKAVSSQTSAFARCFVNCTSGMGCFVSPKFLERLQMRSIKLQRPMPVGSAYGNFSVTEYVILEVRSLYREPYRFTCVFYVVDLSFYPIDLPSAYVSRMAEKKGARLSHNYDTEQTHDYCDMVIGLSHLELTGFEMVEKESRTSRKIDLKDADKGVDADCYYSHFGYILCGKDSSNMTKDTKKSWSTENQ